MEELLHKVPPILTKNINFLNRTLPLHQHLYSNFQYQHNIRDNNATGAHLEKQPEGYPLKNFTSVNLAKEA